MSFWGSLFAGQDKNLDANVKKFGQMGDFSTGLGEKNLSAASKFNLDLLSGDPSKVTSLLAPQISGIQQGVQQEKNQTSTFGNRSGGNNAKMQNAGDVGRASVNDLIAKLTGTAASNAGSMGSNLLTQGEGLLKSQNEASAEQMKTWADSIFGLGVTKASAAGMSAGLKAITGGVV